MQYREFRRLKIYLALDGTKDVTQRVRAEMAGRVGVACLACVLPEGKDPDDLSPEEWDATEADARPALDEWVTAIECEADAEQRKRLREKLGDQAAAWISEDPAGAGEIRARLASGLGLTTADVVAWLGETAESKVQGQKSKVDSNEKTRALSASTSVEDGGAGDANNGGGLAPLAAPGEIRAVVSNFHWESKFTPNKKGLATQAGVDPEVRKKWAELKRLDRERNRTDGEGKKVPLSEADQATLKTLVEAFGATESRVDIADTLDIVRLKVQLALGGWPMRCAAEGCKSGILFADAGGGRVRMIENHIEFQHLLQEYAVLKFNKGQDSDLSNYVSMETLYTDFCSSVAVRSYAVVETVPHEPPIRGHYYVQRPQVDYVPDGSHLGMLLGFFNNIVRPEHKALFAAAIVTQFWGGPYGQRPAFVFEASQPGSGKSTAANLVAQLTSVDGALSITLDKHGEERVRERMLSSEGMRKRVAMCDNVKGSVASSSLEGLVTEKWISGKRLFHGEASRPNTFTFLITSNNARLSSDMARRSFYIHFEKPAQADPQWARTIDLFMRDCQEQVIADCLWVLRQARPALDWTCNPDETFSVWCEEVLARVRNAAAVQVVVGDVRAEDVIKANQHERNDTDEERDEAETFWYGLLEALVASDGYMVTGLMQQLPKDDVFVRTAPPPAVRKKADYGAEDEDREAAKRNMLSFWEAIFGRQVNGKWLANHLDRHIAAGRLPRLRRGRTRRERGYYVEVEAISEYLSSKQADAVVTGDVCDG